MIKLNQCRETKKFFTNNFRNWKAFFLSSRFVFANSFPFRFKREMKNLMNGKSCMSRHRREELMKNS